MTLEGCGCNTQGHRTVCAVVRKGMLSATAANRRQGHTVSCEEACGRVGCRRAGVLRLIQVHLSAPLGALPSSWGSFLHRWVVGYRSGSTLHIQTCGIQRKKGHLFLSKESFARSCRTNLLARIGTWDSLSDSRFEQSGCWEVRHQYCRLYESSWVGQSRDISWRQGKNSHPGLH